MVDDSDSELTDAVLRSEIELLAELIAVVSEVPGRLTDTQVDVVLGLLPPVPRAGRDDGGGSPAHTAS
ncbi:hypothetical protein BJ986_001054 [Phycicoccus badiiscoriae]|uniref:Uncharacterized protein n=1 Tax=Pedococcus badiiscoriae TaxID=642776 RepID=A0A852WBB6_9MICO|nr:hypothetical protein [Pedococcus badiiscoriae]NYG06567.1 hypothetical protein [Pedococcus badiiscoriae]